MENQIYWENVRKELHIAASDADSGQDENGGFSHRLVAVELGRLREIARMLQFSALPQYDCQHARELSQWRAVLSAPCIPTQKIAVQCLCTADEKTRDFWEILLEGLQNEKLYYAKQYMKYADDYNGGMKIELGRVTMAATRLKVAIGQHGENHPTTKQRRKMYGECVRSLKIGCAKHIVAENEKLAREFSSKGVTQNG